MPIGSRPGSNQWPGVLFIIMLIYVLVDWVCGFDLTARPIDWMMFTTNLTAKSDFLADIFFNGKWSLGGILSRATLYFPLKINWAFPIIGLLFVWIALAVVDPPGNLFTVPVSLVIFSFTFGNYFGLVYSRSAAKDINLVMPAKLVSMKPENIGEEKSKLILLKLDKSKRFSPNLPQQQFERGRIYTLTGNLSGAEQSFQAAIDSEVASSELKIEARKWMAQVTQLRDLARGIESEPSYVQQGRPSAKEIQDRIDAQEKAKRHSKFRESIPSVGGVEQIAGLIIMIIVFLFMNYRSGFITLISSLGGSGVGLLLGSAINLFRDISVDWEALCILWSQTMGYAVLYLVIWLHMILRAIYPQQPIYGTSTPEGDRQFVDEKIISAVIPGVFCSIVIFCGTIQAGVPLAILFIGLMEIGILIWGAVVWFGNRSRPWLSHYRAKRHPDFVDCLESNLSPNPDPHWKSDGVIKNATIWDRICSLSIDNIILSSFVMAPVALLFNLRSLPQEQGLYIHTWLWFELILIAYSGQTLGMRFLGLACVGRDGKVIGIFRSFFRYLIGSFLYPIGLIVGLVSKKNQMLHDKIVSTYVVKLREVSRWRRIAGHIAGGLSICEMIVGGIFFVVYVLAK